MVTSFTSCAKSVNKRIISLTDGYNALGKGNCQGCWQSQQRERVIFQISFQVSQSTVRVTNKGHVLWLLLWPIADDSFVATLVAVKDGFRASLVIDYYK